MINGIEFLSCSSTGVFVPLHMNLTVINVLVNFRAILFTALSGSIEFSVIRKAETDNANHCKKSCLMS